MAGHIRLRRAWEVGPGPSSSLKNGIEKVEAKLLIVLFRTESVIRKSWDECKVCVGSVAFIKAILDTQINRLSGEIESSGLENPTNWVESSKEMVLEEIMGSQTLLRLSWSKAPEFLRALLTERISAYKGHS